MLPPMRPPAMPYFNGIPKRQTHTRLYALAFFHELQLAGPVGPYSFASPPCGGFALDSIVISLYIAYHELQGFHTPARPKIYFKRQSRRSCIPLTPMITAPKITSTTPVARFSVWGCARLANTAATRAHQSVNTTHSAHTVRSGRPPMAKCETAPVRIAPAPSSGKRRIKRKNPEC